MPRDYCWNNTYTYEKWKKFDHFLGKVAPDEYIFVGDDDDDPIVREFLNRTNDMPRETKSDREARQEVGYEVFSRAKEDGSVTGKNPPAIAMEESLKPSPSIQPTYGERTSNYEDGATYVYLMLFPGGPEVLLGKSRDHVGQALVKVGRSDDPERRLGEVNFGFPKPQAQGWELNKRHRFLDGDTATDIEKIIKKEFDKEFTSQGGEFFTGDLDAMQSHFDDLCKSRMPENLGAPGKARGI